MSETILFVDDNRIVLEALLDMFSDDQSLRLLTANSAEEALKFVRQEEVAVVVCDYIMPGMNGVVFLSSLSSISPITVKILMSAYADLTSALAAINQSEVYRYVLKPWQDKEMLDIVRLGVQRYRLLQQLRKEDEDILRSLAQTIELKDPLTRGHCDRVAVYALMIAKGMKIPKEVQREIKFGSWLHDCGKIGVSEGILNGNRKLTGQEFETMKMHSFWGADVAAKANLSQVARNIIHYHHERFDGSGYPEGLSGGDIPLEARIVAVADVYDALTNDRPYRKGYTMDEAVALMKDMQGTTFDPEISELFFALLKTGKVHAEIAAL